MKVRTASPTGENKYYIMKACGGYSPCIQGNDQYGYRPFTGSVLPNCVGASTGRFNEIIDENVCRYLGNTNAKNFYALAKAQGLEVGSKPKPGACIVWSSSGCGHVASVEYTNWTNYIETWESGWTLRGVSRYVKRNKGSGNWGQSSAYKFLGFIYNPNVVPYQNPSISVRLGTRGDAARFVQWCLWKDECYPSGKKSEVDGVFGKKSVESLMTFQKKHGLDPDGIAGPLTQGVMKERYTLIKEG